MTSPLFSVLIPVYNQEGNLKNALNSVLDAINEVDDEDVQIVICNDGSTDNSKKVIESFVDKHDRVFTAHAKHGIDKNWHRFIFIDNHQNHGYGWSMNMMIYNVVIGKYVCILEPDDALLSNFFLSFKNIIQEHGNLDMIKCMYLSDDRECNLKKKLEQNEEIDSLYNDDFPLELLLHHPSIWSAIYSKQFLFENNICFEEASGAGWVDNLFLFKTVLLAKSMFVSHQFVYDYNASQTDNSMSKFDKDIPIRRMYAVRNWLRYHFNADSKEGIPEEILYAFSFRVAQYIDLIVNKYRLSSEEDIQMQVDGLVQWCSVEQLTVFGQDRYADLVSDFKDNLYLLD